MSWRKLDPSQKGKCSLALQKDKLIIVFSRTLFKGKQKTLSLNLVDSPANRAIALSRLNAIQTDIELDRFDPTLEKYKPQIKQQDYADSVEILYPNVTLMSLWAKYFQYKQPNLKESTQHYLKTSVENYLYKSNIKSPYQALELRKWLLKNTTQSMAKRVLTYANSAFKWGLKHKLVKGKNPYEGMPNELHHHYEIETRPNAFSEAEKQAVINAFANHCCHYTGFVRFLFLTGCRPNEAIGLRWHDVDPDSSKIIFDGGIYQLSNGKSVRSRHSKNNRIRAFPCNSELMALMKLLKPQKMSPDDLVFYSPIGKTIGYGNFSRQWKKIVDPIKLHTTPYCCRDTFITEQIVKGVHLAIIAKWTDTSTTMIEKHYFDCLNVSQILPR